MLRKISKGLRPSTSGFQPLLVISSAILLILSFPNYNLEVLAWVALVPLLLAIERRSPLKAFLLSYTAGVIFFFGAIYWLAHVTLLGMVLTVFYLGIYFGFFALSLSFIFKRSPECSHLFFLFFIPAAWVMSEWLRSNMMSGFGWALLGYSQSYNLAFIQIADMFGAYGVSFLVALVNTAIFLGIKSIREKKTIYLEAPVIITALIVGISLAYGILRLNNIFTGERLRVGIVQGNISQDKKWDVNFREEILRKYEMLTEKLSDDKTDLVIWPETSVPAYLESDLDAADRIKTLVQKAHTKLLVGAPRDDKTKKDVYYNSAILYSEEGKVIGVYDKIHLVPFGEYVPMKRIFSFVENFAPSPIGDFTKGEERTVFNFFIKRKSKGKDFSMNLIKKVKFSALICFEDIFPELSRSFVGNGALFLVNMTNDAWFKESSAPYQHAQSSVFRAVENRVNVLRATNTGLSCFIDQKGNISNIIENDGKRLFVDGYKVGEIVMANTRTFYNRYGDLFAYACIFFVVISNLFYAIIGRGKK